MIRTLNDAILFLEAEASAANEIGEHIRLKTPGLSDQQARALVEALPAIPASYVSVARSIKLNGAAIGYFSLGPWIGRTSPVESLAAAQGDATNPFFERLRHEGLIEVGSIDGDPILVGTVRSPEFKDGEVLVLSHESPSGPLHRIAKSFEQLVVLATNLEKLSSHGCNQDSAARFVDVLSALEDDPERRAWWQRHAAMVLE